MDDYEELRQLKSRYCHMSDDKNWTALGELFLEDATFSYEGAGVDAPLRIKGRAEIIAHVTRNISDITTAHHVTTAELELLSETEARGRYGALYIHAKGQLFGCGTYRETYQKVDGHWRFATMAVEQTMITTINYASAL